MAALRASCLCARSSSIHVEQSKGAAKGSLAKANPAHPALRPRPGLGTAPPGRRPAPEGPRSPCFRAPRPLTACPRLRFHTRAPQPLPPPSAALSFGPLYSPAPTPLPIRAALLVVLLDAPYVQHERSGVVN
jgi:hypothetical protein